MKKNHLTTCVIGVALAVALLLALGVNSSTLLILGVALACPLMMLIMMRSMGMGSEATNNDVAPDKGNDQPHPSTNA